MAKGISIEQLDKALEVIMADPDAKLPPLDPRLAALLRIAADLRDLPSVEFKARLKVELLSRAEGAGAPAVPDYGKPLVTKDDIQARLKQLAGEPKFVAYDVHDALSGLPEMSMRFLASFNRCTIGVTRGSAPSHWERHPDGDEMLHVLEGETDVVTLTDGGPVHSTARAGSLFICPRGLWHRLLPRSPVSILFATPGKGTELSSAEDPRRIARRRTSLRQGAGRRRRSSVPRLEAYDLGAALSGVPELAITPSTTRQEADAAFRMLRSFDNSTIGVMRFSGQTPWERHPDGDELLYAIDGEVEVTTLAAGGPARTNLRAGSLFICPRGLWHRQFPRRAVTMLFVTPTKTTEASFAEDPRIPGEPAKFNPTR